MYLFEFQTHVYVINRPLDIVIMYADRNKLHHEYYNGIETCLCNFVVNDGKVG